MAVYTDVDPSNLDAFLARYDIGACQSLDGIAEGIENSNFRLTTDQGTFILTLFEKRANPDELPYFLALMEHLAEMGITCPLPIKDKTGRSLSTLMGKPATIVSFLNGRPIEPITADACHQAGALLASMHLASTDFEGHRENDLGLPNLRTLFGRLGSRADEVEDGLANLIDTELTALQSNWPDHLPKGTVHADLFPDNVLFDKGKLSGVIDFYFASTDILAYDLAVTILSWAASVDGPVDPDLMAAMIEGYDSVRPLTDDEYAALPLLMREAAMRFLLTRLHDWVHRVRGAMGIIKDPLEYLRKLEWLRENQQSK
ncbi:MAG: homoserine kinase [Sphingomonadales bacterium]|nr:homoserine kinase [Sphingomonadales bacterium]